MLSLGFFGDVNVQGRPLFRESPVSALVQFSDEAYQWSLALAATVIVMGPEGRGLRLRSERAEAYPLFPEAPLFDPESESPDDISMSHPGICARSAQAPPDLP